MNDKGKNGVKRQVHLRGFRDADTFQQFGLKPGAELIHGVPDTGYIAGCVTDSLQAFNRELLAMNTNRTRYVSFEMISIDPNGNATSRFTKSSNQARKFWG